jgi:hypothetical protein
MISLEQVELMLFPGEGERGRERERGESGIKT